MERKRKQKIRKCSIPGGIQLSQRVQRNGWSDKKKGHNGLSHQKEWKHEQYICTEPVWYDLLLGTLLASEVHRGGQPKRRTPPSPDPKPSRPSIPTGSPSDPNRAGTPSIRGRVEGRQEDRDQQADQKDPQRQPGCCLWLEQALWVGPQQAGGLPGALALVTMGTAPR